MREEKFTLNIGNKNFNFEIDTDGYVWIMKKMKSSQCLKKLT